jgi:uncharacterized protein YndB with AHSA1/START domain
MSERSVTHATFVIERTYTASPARVFEAWANPASKSRWFACHDEWTQSTYELDFRVGGHERLRTGPAGGPVHAFDGRYHDIVPDRRIVYAYDMYVGERRISVSLATVEFEPAGVGARTRMIFTEQIVFLDGAQTAAEREEGTRAGLDNLEAELQREIVMA